MGAIVSTAEQFAALAGHSLAGSRFPKPSRAWAIAFATAVHCIVVLALLHQFKPASYVARVSEIQLTLWQPHVIPPSPPSPPIQWAFSAPEDVEVPEPKMLVLPDPNEPAAMTSSADQTLPPRPDPNHANPSPPPPPSLAAAAAGARVVLALDILPDGSIAAVRVEKTCGHRDVDQIAMLYVKDNWRFLPAYRAGQPIEGWIFVQVRFAAG